MMKATLSLPLLSLLALAACGGAPADATDTSSNILSTTDPYPTTPDSGAAAAQPDSGPAPDAGTLPEAQDAGPAPDAAPTQPDAGPKAPAPDAGTEDAGPNAQPTAPDAGPDAVVADAGTTDSGDAGQADADAGTVTPPTWSCAGSPASIGETYGWTYALTANADGSWTAVAGLPGNGSSPLVVHGMETTAGGKTFTQYLDYQTLASANDMFDGNQGQMAEDGTYQATDTSSKFEFQFNSASSTVSIGYFANGAALPTWAYSLPCNGQ